MHAARLFLLAASGLLAAACASNSAAPIRGPGSGQQDQPIVRPESGEIQAANIKRLYPNKRLFVCRGTRVSNRPDTFGDNEVLNYSRLVVVNDVPLVTAPANNACVSSGFGMRDLGDGLRMHKGVDITSSPASRVFSGGAGRILEAGMNGGYGLAVLIDHGNGVYTRYAHLNHIEDDIKPGARVVYGHPIGLMGRSGHVTGIHLHYEILTGTYRKGVFGRGLTAHNPFDFPEWIDQRLIQ